MTIRPWQRIGRRAAGVLALAIASWSCAIAAGAQQTQVQRGEYLARAGDCISCHTAKGGEPYAGGLRLDSPFGYMLSSNITPDPETGIGRWSSTDFQRAMHDGVNNSGKDMYPLMPYDFYTKVTREDIDAIFAYLRTLKPVRNQLTSNHLNFPFNQRWSMAAWRELYFTEGTFKADAAQKPSWNRGAYLVEGLGHCSDCHSPRNIMGAIEKDKAFTGATIDGWFALNLSSNLHTGLGQWTVDEIATYLKTGAYKGKTTALQAMAEYLKSIPANSALRTPRKLPDDKRMEIAALYLDHCSGCHQALGRGIPGTFPPLAGNGVVLARDPGNIIQVVLGGIPAQGTYAPMPSFASQLTDKGIADLANYLRTSWGNTASPNVTPAMVAKLRRAK